MKTTDIFEDFRAIEAELRSRIDSGTLAKIKESLANGDAITKHAFAIALDRHLEGYVPNTVDCNSYKWDRLVGKVETDQETPAVKTSPNIPDKERLRDIYEILLEKSKGNLNEKALSNTLAALDDAIKLDMPIAWSYVLYLADSTRRGKRCLSSDVDDVCVEIAKESNTHTNTGIGVNKKGVVTFECTFEKGKRHGEQLVYFDCGVIIQNRCKFVGGSIFGKSITYNQNGDILYNY